MPRRDTNLCAMRLSEMRRANVSQERTAGGDGTCYRLREIICTGARVRELFAHAGFDMRIGGTGATRRRQRQIPGYTPRMLDGRRGVFVLLVSGWLVNSEDIEGRLIHEYLDGLRHHAGNGAYGVANFGVSRDGEPGAETARHLGIIGGGGRTNGNERPRQVERRIQELRETAAGDDFIDESIAERAPPEGLRLDARVGAQHGGEHEAAAFAHDMLMNALADLPRRGCRVCGEQIGRAH